MKVTYLSQAGYLGGAETSLLEILASLKRSEPGWELSLVAPGDGLLVSRARALGIPTTVLPFPAVLARLGEPRQGAGVRAGLGRLGRLPHLAWAVASYRRRLRRLLAAAHPQIVHANGLKMHLLGALARPRDSALVWHVHDYIGPRRATARLLRRYAGRCAVVVANSRSVADDVRSVLGDRVNISTIYNAVDLRRFAPTGPVLDLDALAGFPRAEPGTVKVGLVATFARWKGHDRFLEALAKLPDTPAVRAYVIGGPIYETDGSQRSLEELRRLARDLGISARVGFTGFVEEPASAMRALDIVVHASTEPEPFGLVIAESMACGRAVIAVQAGGASEIIDDGVTALALRPGDSSHLAAGIARLAMDPALRARLGQAARASAVERFDSRHLASRLAPLYRDLVPVLN